MFKQVLFCIRVFPCRPVFTNRLAVASGLLPVHATRRLLPRFSSTHHCYASPTFRSQPQLHIRLCLRGHTPLLKGGPAFASPPPDPFRRCMPISYTSPRSSPED